MNVLVILKHKPYDGSGVVWNGLRLAEKLLQSGMEVRVLLMGDSVDVAHDVLNPPMFDFCLGRMLKDLMAKGADVKYCETSNDHSSRSKINHYFDGVDKVALSELSEWVKDADRILTF